MKDELQPVDGNNVPAHHQQPTRESAQLKWLRIIGSAEGISFLLLLFVAMPLKYIGQNPSMVHWLGPIHGGLFLLYVAAALVVARNLRWPWTHLLMALIASVVPAGPFAFDVWQRSQNAAIVE